MAGHLRRGSSDSAASPGRSTTAKGRLQATASQQPSAAGQQKDAGLCHDSWSAGVCVRPQLTKSTRRLGLFKIQAMVTDIQMVNVKATDVQQALQQLDSHVREQFRMAVRWLLRDGETAAKTNTVREHGVDSGGTVSEDAGRAPVTSSSGTTFELACIDAVAALLVAIVVTIIVLASLGKVPAGVGAVIAVIGTPAALLAVSIYTYVPLGDSAFMCAKLTAIESMPRYAALAADFQKDTNSKLELFIRLLADSRLDPELLPILCDNILTITSCSHTSPEDPQQLRWALLLTLVRTSRLHTLKKMLLAAISDPVMLAATDKAAVGGGDLVA